MKFFSKYVRVLSYFRKIVDYGSQFSFGPWAIGN